MLDKFASYFQKMKGIWQDRRNFFSKLNGRRLLNAQKVWGSYQYSRWRGHAFHKGMPISLSIEPTTSCNLRCPECPSGLRSFTRPTGMLQTETYRQVLDQVSGTLLYLLFYFQGEPYLNSDFLDHVHYAHRKHIYTATSTNAHYLDDVLAEKTIRSGLDRLVISIDGASQESYAAYRRGGNLEKVITGARNIVQWKKKLRSSTPHTVFQFLVVKPNEHEINAIQALAKEIGIDEVVFKTAQIYDYADGSPLIPSIAKYSRYKQGADGRFIIKNKLLNQCWKMWHSCVITWDGQIVPCCFDKDAEHAMGNVLRTDFGSLWHGEAYQNFRQSLLQSRSQIEMCRNCTEGTKVWA